jgi:uncharacterized protein YutE (UPF0331/DUF86 family)
MYNIEVIKRHLVALLDSLERLKKFQKLDEKELYNNLDLVWILERGIYLCIQNLLDIFAHIVSADLNLKWESYAEIADTLYNSKIIIQEEKDLLVLMAGFRNRLSHDYTGLDKTVLLDIVNHKIDDFYKFIKIIKEYCKISDVLS